MTPTVDLQITGPAHTFPDVRKRDVHRVAAGTSRPVARMSVLIGRLAVSGIGHSDVSGRAGPWVLGDHRATHDGMSV